MGKIIDPKKNDDQASYLRWIGFGIEFCGVLAIFSYIGIKLDEHFGTSPWLFVVAFLWAFVGMIYLLLKETQNIWRK